MDNPFLQVPNDSPCAPSHSIVALRGARNGYLQIAPRQEVTTYRHLPLAVLAAAQAWAAMLEDLGARRVYWITLAEVVRHLHIHLYPRWEDADPQGLPLFEGRNNPHQPAWTPQVEDALQRWMTEHEVAVRTV